MRKLAIIFALLCGSAAAQVTCVALGPTSTGSGSGANWSNMKSYGSVTFARGTRYYLADGTGYPGLDFKTANSTTVTVEIRKAQTYDFGRTADGCSSGIDVGWNPATMGAGQAVFGTSLFAGHAWYPETNYLTINGNGTLTTAGCGGGPSGSASTSGPVTITDCGIKVDDTANCGSGVIGSGAAVTGFIVHDVEYSGCGNATTEDFVSRLDNCNTCSMTHMYIHNFGSVCSVIGGATNFTFDDNYMFRNQVISGGNPAHGQCLQSFGDHGGFDVGRNVFRDLGGTAIIMAWVGSGSVQAGPYNYYDNQIWTTPGFSPAFPSANGILACINGFTCNNVTMSQNTIWGMGSSQKVAIDSETGGTFIVQNNIWYSSSNNANPGPHGTFTQDHNSYLASGTSCPSGTGNVCNNTAANPFVSPSTGNFALTADGSNVNSRTSLSAPFNVDAVGTTFTTDRGAFQFVSGGATFNTSPSAVPSHHTNAITLTITGSGLTPSATFAITGVTGAVLSGCTNTSTTGTCNLVTGSGTGTATITDITDSVSSPITIATATLAISPSAGNTSTTPTLTLTGGTTLWTTETAAGLFTVSIGLCSGDSIATPTVTTDTAATATLTTGSATCTITVTDTSTTATAAFTVAAPTTPTVTTGTAGSLTSSSALISSNSYVCTGSCSVVTSEGTCVGLAANPTTSCTSDGTTTPFSSSLTGLSASTTYHYRAFAANAAGTSYGSDQTFSTPAVGIVYLTSSSCSTAVTETGASATWTASCTPTAAGDAITMFAQCHPTSGTITGITLTAPGWTINQIVPPASTGSNSWGAIFGAIAPNTSAATFTATFTGGSNCTNFAIFLGAEFSGNDPTGGTTTFNATGSASGAGSTCNQAGAALTPPLNNEAVWYACLLGSATTATSPWTLGAADGNGNSSEYQILTGGTGVAQTPAFNGSSGAYVIEGVAIAPAPTVSCPPPYYCAYTGTDIVQPAATPPNLGTYTNNGAIVFDSSYLSHTLPTPYQQSRIARCTDQNFTPSNGLLGFSAGQGGSSGLILFNTDSTLIHVVTAGGGAAIAQFSPSTMVCSPAITKDKDLTNPGSSSTLGSFGTGEFSGTDRTIWWADGVVGTEVTSSTVITPIAIDPSTGFYSFGSTAADFEFGLPVGSNVAEWQANHAYTAGFYVKHTLAGADLKTWAAITAFSQGDIIYPGAPNCGFMVRTAGTTSGSQPTWPLVGGVCGPNPTTVTDGTVIWRSMVSSPPAIITQLVSAGGTSGGSTPTFAPSGHPDLGTLVTDGSLTWEVIGVNLLSQGGVWSNTAKTSFDGTRFSESFSINTYGANPASPVSTNGGVNYANANGQQGTADTAIMYDATLNIYHLMNSLTSIQTDWVCTGGTGYNCSGGSFVQTPRGTATGSPCPFILHESGGSADASKIHLDINNQFINNGGGCPFASGLIWAPTQSFNAVTQLQLQLAPINHAAFGFNTLAGLAQAAATYGFQTGIYENSINLSNPGALPPTSWQAFPCQTLSPPVWTRGSSTQPCQTQIDEHLSWAFNPNHLDSTPLCGAFYEVNSTTANSASPGAAYEGEVVCFSSVPTETSLGSAQLGTQWRFAHTFNFQTNRSFNVQFQIGQESQDGRYFAHSTDNLGQFGSTTGSAPVLPITNSAVQCLGGYPWLASTTYALGAVINPIASLNGGGFPFDAYQAVAVTTGISGSTPPNWALTDGTIGAQFVDNGVTWQDLGAGNCRGEVVVVELTPTPANAQANTPTCSPGSGIYGSTQTISCSDTSPGAVICYAVAPVVPVTNGVSSCTVGTPYVSTFTVATTQQINIIAGGAGFSDSALQSYSYTIGSSSPPVGVPGRPAIDILLNP